MAGLGGCITCIKYCLFVFNFIFWAIGCALVGVGIWVIVDAKRFLSIYTNNVQDDIRAQVGVLDESIVQSAGIAIIVVGGIIMITGFLGCCGAIRESQVMLAVFFTILFLIFAALVAIGIVAIVRKDWVKDMVGKAMRLEAGENTQSGSSRSGNTLLAYSYRNYGCCGVDDMATCDKDYPPLYTTAGSQLPCGKGSQGCQKGCLNVVWGVMSQMAIGAGIAALVGGGIIIFGMIFSMCLCCAIRQK